MNPTVPLLIKVRDIAIGFFGWLIFSNLIFLLLLYLYFEVKTPIKLGLELPVGLINLLMWLFAIVTILGLFLIRRIWLCTGVVAVIIINTMLWIVFFLFLRGSLSDLIYLFIMFSGFPLPVGIFGLVLFMSPY